MIKTIKRVFSLSTRLVYLLFWVWTLVSVFAPYLPLGNWAYLQLFPIGLTYFFVVHCLALGYYVWRKKPRSWVLLAVLGVIMSGVGVRKDVGWNRKEGENHNLKVLSYNVKYFRFRGKEVSKVNHLIRKQNADIICLQEFLNFDPENREIELLPIFADSLGMPHYGIVLRKHSRIGTAIFSKYPLVNLDTLFISKANNNTGVFATVQLPEGPLGIANIHLDSYSFSTLLRHRRSFRQNLSIIAQKASEVVPRQMTHLDKVFHQLDSYPHPIIFAGDMNSAPHTKVIRQFTSRYSDSFMVGGRGMGWTFPILGKLGMRIDYQFASEGIMIKEHEVLYEGNSDHYPILVSYQFPAPQP